MGSSATIVAGGRTVDEPSDPNNKPESLLVAFMAHGTDTPLNHCKGEDTAS
jgi:hypothetical protein